VRTPLSEAGRGAYVADLHETGSGIFLVLGMDRLRGDLPVGQRPAIASPLMLDPVTLFVFDAGCL
jgi:hypothetical protein